MSSRGGARPEDRTLQISPEHAYYLQRTQALADLQQELLAWGKRRFWIVALATIAIGFVGMRTIVRDLAHDELRAAIRASADAEASAKAARDATAKAKAGVEDYQNTVEELRVRAGEVDKRYKDLETKLAARSENVREEARLSGRSTALELSKLRAAIGDLLTRVGNVESARDFKSDLAKVRESTETLKANFAENSKYTIPFSYRTAPSSYTSAFLSVLKKAGFQVPDHANTDFAIDEKNYFKRHPEGTLTRLTENLLKHSPASRSKATEIAALLKSVPGARSVRLIEDSDTTTDYFPVWLPGK